MNSVTLNNFSYNLTTCVAPAGLNVYVMYYKVKEVLGTSYNIVKVFSAPMPLKNFELGKESAFTIQIDYVSVDDLNRSGTQLAVIPKEIAEILQKLFEIS